MFGIQVDKPKITKVATKDGMECYTMQCTTGILSRTYEICWKEKKIQKLKQTALK